MKRIWIEEATERLVSKNDLLRNMNVALRKF